MTPSHITQLLSSFGVPVRPYSTYDFGRERDENAISVVVSEQEARSRLNDLRASLPEGYVAFIGTTNWLGDEQHDGFEVVIAPAASKFDILRIARSDAVNFDIDTEELVSKFEDIDKRFGIDIVQAETDTVEITLDQLPDDMFVFAEEVYAFCPDIVDQGIGSVEDLADAIEMSGSIHFWWD